MKEKEKLNQLKTEYNNIEIPDELDFLVRSTIHKGSKQQKPFKFKRAMIAAILVFGIFVGGINISPTLAQTLAEIPILGQVVNIFTFVNFKVEEENFEADIKVPNISRLNDEELESSLNAEFIKEGQSLYEEFNKQMEQLKSAEGNGHLALESTYEIKTDNDQILSVIITKLETMASSSTSYTSYTVDKLNKDIVTLPSLFKNDSYIEAISDNIKTQMRQRMKEDENISYFIDSVDIPVDDFEKIDANQNFYINQDGKLVILFNEYEYAPGYMGPSEFVIPTDIIQDLLLDRGLIK